MSGARLTPAAELVARRVRGGFAADASHALLLELVRAHSGAALAHALHYQGFLSAGAVERFAGVAVEDPAPWAGLPCFTRGCVLPAAAEWRDAEGYARPACAAHALRCSWCGADPGAPCVTRAAHPVTGRGVLVPVDTHPERLRCSWCDGGADAVDCGAPAHARMLEVDRCELGVCGHIACRPAGDGPGVEL